jgi:hypothetical protein
MNSLSKSNEMQSAQVVVSKLSSEGMDFIMVCFEWRLRSLVLFVTTLSLVS